MIKFKESSTSHIQNAHIKFIMLGMFSKGRGGKTPLFSTDTLSNKEEFNMLIFHKKTHNSNMHRMIN